MLIATCFRNGYTIMAFPDGRLVEIIELPNHPFIATQFHPEFQSRPSPHPLFKGFVQAVMARSHLPSVKLQLRCLAPLAISH